MMCEEARKADVIDLSSDDEDCFEEQSVVAGCGLTDAVEKRPFPTSFSRDTETAKLEDEHNFQQRVSQNEREKCIKEENVEGGECSKGFAGSSHLRDSQKWDNGTGSTSARRFVQVQDRKVQLEGRDAPRDKACDSVDAVQTNFLGSHFIPCSLPANAQQKQISRRFWKAGDYEVQASSVRTLHNGMDHVRVHPKFLHSNATSHKWALGAIAELLDNAIDEVQNGATFVTVDKVANPRDNSPALLIQDDGGGMDPDCMRQCMSLGYSRKTTNTTIGQYGNGFKTSTMRLGADVIVFSCCTHNRLATQSIGLLSYTFLRATGHEDIVVPMVDFELSPTGGQPKMLIRTTKDDWLNNLSTLLQWSPYTTEAELLKQFDDLGWHGTKVIVYNLWLNDDGELELDFDTDKQDIQLRGTPKLEKADTLQRQLTNQHIANRLRYSLRAYATVLYLRMPSNFQIFLRGKVVQHQSIAEDLKFPERIMYKPQIGNSRDFGAKEVSVITTIGFAKEAPMINVHGFNVYHKNRLIMPFWKVFHENSSRGKGVVGVLEANFMEPAHDKQDFERTPILQRLETRLKQMTIEYWNLHCELIGYQPPKLANKGRYPPSNSSGSPTAFPAIQPVNQVEAYPQTVVATGIPAAVVAPSNLDAMVDVKPSLSSSSGADLNRLHSSISSARPAIQIDEHHNDQLRARASNCSSDANLNNGLRNCNGSASAPSTPPQPGSDAGVLCKQMDSTFCEKSDEQKVGNSPQSDEVGDAIDIQITTSVREDDQTQGTLSAKVLVDAKNVVSAKRSAIETCLPNIGGDLKRQELSAAGQMVRVGINNCNDQRIECINGQTPVSAMKLAEVLEEAEQLRIRCMQYEHREKELEFKVAQLQHELLEVQSKYIKLLMERNSLKLPKEES